MSQVSKEFAAKWKGSSALGKQSNKDPTMESASRVLEAAWGGR